LGGENRDQECINRGGRSGGATVEKISFSELTNNGAANGSGRERTTAAGKSNVKEATNARVSVWQQDMEHLIADDCDSWSQCMPTSSDGSVAGFGAGVVAIAIVMS
jgi:hypothetical protein